MGIRWEKQKINDILIRATCVLSEKVAAIVRLEALRTHLNRMIGNRYVDDRTSGWNMGSELEIGDVVKPVVMTTGSRRRQHDLSINTLHTTRLLLRSSSALHQCNHSFRQQLAHDGIDTRRRPHQRREQ